jgi:hypothetical protein
MTGWTMQSFFAKNTASTGCTRVRPQRYRRRVGPPFVSCGVGLFVLLVAAGSIQAHTSAGTPQSETTQQTVVPAFANADQAEARWRLRPIRGRWIESDATNFECNEERVHQALHRHPTRARAGVFQYVGESLWIVRNAAASVSGWSRSSIRSTITRRSSSCE